MPNPVDIPDRPLMLQGVGAVGYSALELRRTEKTPAGQEGIFDAGDFKVTPAGGLLLAVADGECNITGDSVADQGAYYQRLASAVTTLSTDAPHATLPRIDQVVVEVKDDAHDAGGLNVGRLRTVVGTATAGATLDNRTGAAALPATCVRIADVLVPAAFGGPFVAATHLRDRRPWARGAYRFIGRNVNAAAGNDYTFAASANFQAVDTVNLSPRVECSGVPVRLHFRCGAAPPAANTEIAPGFHMDGVGVGGASDPGGLAGNYIYTNTWAHGINAALDLVPAAGSHVFRPVIRVSTTVAVYARASAILQFAVEEILRQNADNS